MSIGNCRRIFRIFHEILRSEEDPNEVSEPVGPLVHDSSVCVHVDLDLVTLHQLHNHTLANHAVLVVRVMVLVIEAGHLMNIEISSESD